jgi:hypothetical protein
MMTDATTHQRLRVSTDGTAGPYIMVPVSQLEELKALLNRNGIRYSVDENAISLDGKPEIAVINLGRNASATAVQNILDSVR